MLRYQLILVPFLPTPYLWIGLADGICMYIKIVQFFYGQEVNEKVTKKNSAARTVGGRFRILTDKKSIN